MSKDESGYVVHGFDYENGSTDSKSDSTETTHSHEIVDKNEMSFYTVVDELIPYDIKRGSNNFSKFDEALKRTCQRLNVDTIGVLTRTMVVNEQSQIIERLKYLNRMYHKLTYLQNLHIESNDLVGNEIEMHEIATQMNKLVDEYEKVFSIFSFEIPDIKSGFQIDKDSSILNGIDQKEYDQIKNR